MPKLFNDKYNLIVPSITPIIKGKVDYSSLKALFNFLIESKVDLIFILGTTGEFIVLSLREKLDIIKFSIDHIRYKIPLLVGVSAKTEEEMQKLIKETNKMEFGTIVVTPLSYGSDAEEVINIALQGSRLPIIIYNNPAI